MYYSNRIIGIVLISIFSIVFSYTMRAESTAPISAVPDGKGNIAFTMVVENLPLTSAEILEVANKYLKEEYKTAKYSDITVLGDKGITFGKGNLNAIYTDNKIAGSDVYSLDFILKFDCKDGKARIQFIAKDYNVNTFSELKGTETSTVGIINTPPFVKGKKNFNKIYKALEGLANEILESGKRVLKSATPIPAVEEW